MQAVDPDVIVGGPGLAYWLQTNPTQFPNDQRVSGTYFAQQVANSSLPLDFFSFHAIAACTDAATCDIADVRAHCFSSTALFARNSKDGAFLKPTILLIVM